MITSEDLRTLASERQASLRQEASVARMVRRTGAARPIRIVKPDSSRLSRTASTVIALAYTPRLEH